MIDRRAQCVRANLRDDRIGSLANIHRSLVQRDSSATLQADADRRRIGEGGVSAAVPHSCDTNTATQRTRSTRVKLLTLASRSFPSWTERLQALPNTDSLAKNLSGHGRRLTVECIQNSEFQPVHPNAIGQFVVKLLLGNS